MPGSDVDIEALTPPIGGGISRAENGEVNFLYVFIGAKLSGHSLTELILDLKLKKTAKKSPSDPVLKLILFNAHVLLVTDSSVNQNVYSCMCICVVLFSLSADRQNKQYKSTEVNASSQSPPFIDTQRPRQSLHIYEVVINQ